jgi:hypothetical protein
MERLGQFLFLLQGKPKLGPSVPADRYTIYCTVYGYTNCTVTVDAGRQHGVLQLQIGLTWIVFTGCVVKGFADLQVFTLNVFLLILIFNYVHEAEVLTCLITG